MKRFFKIIQHNTKPILILSFIFIVISLWAFGFFETIVSLFNLPEEFFSKPSFDWKSWDKWITVLTFAVAILIGWQGYVRRWENGLPNKITVHFIYNGKYIMSCYRAYLSGSDDVRNWGQHIGKQMAAGQYLDIEPRIKQNKMKIINNEFKHYEITFYLYEEPNIFQSENLKNKYITWVVETEKINKKQHQRENCPLDLKQAGSEGEKLTYNKQKSSKNQAQQNNAQSNNKVFFYYAESESTNKQPDPNSTKTV